jgi:3-methylcrotonyl-CoA carboxylase alpha subunit
VWPVRTNAGFLVRCLEHPRFVVGDVDTGFIAAEEDRLVAADSKEADLAAVALFAQNHYEAPYRNGDDWHSPWHDTAGLMGFRMNASPRSLWALTVGGRKLVAEALSAQSSDSTWLVGPASDRRVVRCQYGDIDTGSVDIGGRALPYVRLGDDVVLFDRGNALSVAAPVFGGSVGGSASDGALRAPMPGKIVAAPARPGDAVTKGQPIVVLEAMKMEHALVAPFDGVVGEIGVVVGDQVAADAVLARVEAASA